MAARGGRAAGGRRLGREAARRRRRAARGGASWSSRASRASPSASCTPTPIRRTSAAIGAAIAERYQNLSISLSSDVSPEIREYLRASTTVANAYIRPLAEIYLERLEQALRAEGIPGGLFLMLSNGGLTHVSEAKRVPVQLLESGPAAGALAGAWFGRNAGLERVLAFDMGGTTAKLALVDDGEPLVAYGFEAAREKRFLRGSGLPMQIATVELIEIGAGGGSIAHRSDLGTLNVGPESSGAQPGPACYGRGGTDATVTDADLTLGYLNADFFLGGAMKIDRAATDTAFGALASALEVEPSRAAFGVHDVVNENMAGAARVAIAERGRVPSEYALLATGGAGPVHAWHVARKLGVKRVVCPPGAGAGSTIGMLMAPARVDRVASFTQPLAGADMKDAERIFADARKGIARRAAPDRRRCRGAHGQASRRHALHRPGQRDHRDHAVAAQRSRRARANSRRPTRRCSPARRLAPTSSSWRCVFR